MRQESLTYRRRAVVCITFLLTFGAARAWAIPAFARRYGTSCTTCHVAFPKVNSYGDAFRRNGYVLPEDDTAFVKEKPVKLGAKAWEELWPQAVWPGEITGSIPFSVYMHQRVVAQFSEDKNKNQVFFDAPHELELLIGMNLGKRFGVFGEWIFFEKEKNAAGLKRLYVQFNDLFSTKDGGLPENVLNVKFGRIEPGTQGGYKDASKRLTMEHPITGDLRALENTGLDGWDSGYRWRMRDLQSGLELNGILGHRFEYAAGIVNGEGVTVSEANGSKSPSKDKYVRGAFKIGVMGFDGHGVGLSETDNWRDDSVTIGAYFYTGTTLKAGESPGSTTENDFDRVGGDFRGQLGGLDVMGGFMRGTDELDGTLATDDVDSSAWFIEPNYRFLPWLIGLVRFEKFKAECDTGGFDPETGACSSIGSAVLKEATRINPHLLILLRPNIRFGLEYLHENRDWWKGGRPESGTDNAKSSKWVKANFQIAF